VHGHDVSHYLCDTENFRSDCTMEDLQEEDSLVLIPDENDAFSYNQLLVQLRELHDGVESHPVTDLFAKSWMFSFLSVGNSLLKIVLLPRV
jgi:hypothetical protein